MFLCAQIERTRIDSYYRKEVVFCNKKNTEDGCWRDKGEGKIKVKYFNYMENL